MLEMDGTGGLLEEDSTRLGDLTRKMNNWIKESKDQYHLSDSVKVTQKMVLGVYAGLEKGWTEEVEGFFEDTRAVIEEETAETDPDAPIEPPDHRPLCRAILLASKSILLYVCKFLEGSRPYAMLGEAVGILLSYQNRMLPPGTDARLALIAALKGNFANQLGHTSDSVKFFKQVSK